MYQQKIQHERNAHGAQKIDCVRKMEGWFQCHICPKPRYFVDLATHLKIIHGVGSSIPETNLFRCDICDSTFVKKFSINKHMILNHKSLDRKIHACSICKREFFSEESRDKHSNFVHHIAQVMNGEHKDRTDVSKVCFEAISVLIKCYHFPIILTF